jgi:hypothetical protein
MFVDYGDVARSGWILVVTEKGPPIVEIHPCWSGEKAVSPLGLHSSLKIKGEIVEPVDESFW